MPTQEQIKRVKAMESTKDRVSFVLMTTVFFCVLSYGFIIILLWSWSFALGLALDQAYFTPYATELEPIEAQELAVSQVNERVTSILVPATKVAVMFTILALLAAVFPLISHVVFLFYSRRIHYEEYLKEIDEQRRQKAVERELLAIAYDFTPEGAYALLMSAPPAFRGSFARTLGVDWKDEPPDNSDS